MVQRKRRTTRRTVRSTAKKVRSRSKKGVRKAAKAMQITPAQRQKLHKTMREFEKHINTLTRKYNQILNAISRY